jgi:hypothetical protein
MIWIALWGCSRDDHFTEDPPVRTWDLTAHSLPRAPDDPVMISVSGMDYYDWPAQPDVRDASGEPVPLVPLFSGERLEGYVAEGGFAPGVYEVVGSVEYQTVQQARFEVYPYGMAPLDPTSLVGRAWKVSDATLLPQLLDELVWAQLEDIEPIVTIDAVTEEGVEFRVVLRTPEFDCVGFRDRATLDETGQRLRWTEDEATLTLPAGEGSVPVPLHDLHVELAWLAEDDSLGWGTGRGTGDLARLGEALALDQSACELLDALGVECEPCAEGTEATCLPAGAVAGTLEETLEVPASSGLPLCGVDRLAAELPDLELPPLSCDFDLDLDLDLDLGCGCQVLRGRVGLPLVFAGLVLLARRRRHS